jgi:two-component system chemotaxis sensor kinase CheA
MTPMDEDMRAALDTFVTEARELLHDIEEGVLGLEDNPTAADTVAAIFRSVHTLKGSSWLFGLEHIVRFTHVVETILDSVRQGDLDVTPDLVSVLLPGTDHIASMVDGLASGRFEATESELSAESVLLAALEPFLRSGAGQPPATGAEAAAAPVADSQPGGWQLSLRFGADCLRNGLDPLSFLRYLSTIGAATQVTTLADALPAADRMDPETCYLGFRVELETPGAKADIESVFDFVRDDSDIRIRPADDRVDAYVRLIQAMSPSDRVGELLIASGAVTELEVAEALGAQQERTRAGSAATSVGDILVEQGVVQRAIVDAALRKQPKSGGETRPQDTQTIRVDAVRLDKLIDLVGELVIAQAAVGVRASANDRETLLEAQDEVMRLVDEVRHSALSLRMVPIGTTLRRFERVVRDVCVELDKEVSLVVTGGDTEMDKALVDQIGDPLLHLVRNCLDHGIEGRDERAGLGKPTRGTLSLNAFHDAGSIVIEAADDGRGLDRERILAKAVDRGLVEPGVSMTDAEVHALIFEPGFSTADAVSNLSGRGVGMDVVRRNVTALRGTIEVETTPGLGTTIRIRLPLTLAIIDGILVGVGSSAFIVPLDRVTECVELPAGPVGRDCMDLRGEVLPFIRLRSVFGISDDPPRRQSVVVVEQAGQRAGLVVDALLGQFQTVIKPLNALFSDATCISGSTILGNGEVALILDVGPLVADHTEREHALQTR